MIPPVRVDAVGQCNDAGQRNDDHDERDHLVVPQT
jgi:hypothetical protein